MMDRTASLRGLYGTGAMTPMARRICKSRASRRSRAAERSEILQSLFDDDSVVEVAEPYSTWTVLEPISGKFHTRTYIIEADEELAIRVYAARNRGRHPCKTSCGCGCGPDYMLREDFGTLREVTTLVRNCPSRGERFVEGRKLAVPGKWDYHTVEQFLARPDVIFIGADEIGEDEASYPMPVVTYPGMYSEDAQTVAWLFDLEM